MDNNDQKCFCHFQGFQVKDAVSRAALKNINDGVENKAPGSGAVATGIKKDRAGAPDIPAESDWRCNEAHGTGSMASGMGAVAYSRASKSLGYRTQAGHPTSPELAAARPEAVTKKDEAGNTVYPAENVEQAAVAIGADTAAVGKQSLAGGYKSVARGNMSVAIGNMLTADGVDSQAFGSENEVTKKADAAAVFGFRNKVTSAYSFVAGNLCGTDPEKPAHCSAVFGKFNTAVAPGQFICGEFSAPTEDMAFVVGNGVRVGTEDIEDNITRSNGFVVYKDGNAELPGAIKATNTPIEDEENPGCFYYLNAAGEKLWMNPPMLDGVEYKTTEKHMGKPVYMKTWKAYEFGTRPGDYYNVPIAHNLGNIEPIKCDAYIPGRCTLPYFFVDTDASGTKAINGHIAVHATPTTLCITATEAYRVLQSGDVLRVTLWYTKN